MDGCFRVLLNLNHYFHDHRGFARLFVNKKIKTIGDLENRVKEIFHIDDFHLLCQNHFLPSTEDVRLLSSDETVWVIPNGPINLPVHRTPSRDTVESLTDVQDSLKRKNEHSAGSDEGKKPKKKKNKTEYIPEPEYDEIESEEPKHKKKKKSKRSKCDSDQPEEDKANISEMEVEPIQHASYREPIGNFQFEGILPSYRRRITLPTVTDEYLKQKKINIVKIEKILPNGVLNTAQHNQLEDLTKSQNLTGLSKLFNGLNSVNSTMNGESMETSVIEGENSKENMDVSLINIANNTINASKIETEAIVETPKLSHSNAETTEAENINTMNGEPKGRVSFASDTTCNEKPYEFIRIDTPLPKQYYRASKRTETSTSKAENTVNSRPIQFEKPTKSFITKQQSGLGQLLSNLKEKQPALDSIAAVHESADEKQNLNDSPKSFQEAAKEFKDLRRTSLITNTSEIQAEADSLFNETNNSFNDPPSTSQIEAPSSTLPLLREQIQLHGLHETSQTSDESNTSKRSRKRVRKRKLVNKTSTSSIELTPAPHPKPFSKPFVCGKPLMHFKFDDNEQEEVETKNEPESTFIDEEEDFKENPLETITIFDSTTEFELDESFLEDQEQIERQPIMDVIKPRPNDVIMFKTLRIGPEYTAEMSSHIVGRVLQYASTGNKVEFKILNGLDQCSLPEGKFSMDSDEELKTNIRTFDWADLYKPRLLYP